MLEYTLGRVGFSDFFLNFEYLNIFLLEYNRSAHLYIFKFHSYLEICLLFLMQKLNNYKILIISTNKLPKMQGYMYFRWGRLHFWNWHLVHRIQQPILKTNKSWIIQGNFPYFLGWFFVWFINVFFCQKQSYWLKNSWKFRIRRFQICCWIRWARIKHFVILL